MKVRAAGSNVTGQIDFVSGDIVGRDKITFNLSLIEDERTAATLKASLDVIQHVSSLLNDVSLSTYFDGADVWTSTNTSFWLKDALDPLHAAMSAVHEIYMKTFRDVEALLDGADDASVNVALQILSRRHSETIITRDNLQGMRASIGTLSGIPDEIKSYLDFVSIIFFAQQV